MENRERREFFRVDDRLTVKYRVITDEEFNFLENSVRFSPASTLIESDEISMLKKIESDEEKSKDPIYRYLKLIDRKLDMVLDMLSEKFESKKAYTVQHNGVNLSASGIRFISQTPMKAGDFVELIIILPIYPYTKILTLCKVIRCNLSEKHGVSNYEVALHYLVINEYDRDMLIKYILMKEREVLRTKREIAG